MTEKVLAVDVGGTRFRVGVADAENPVLVRTIAEWPVPRDRQSFLALCSEQLAASGARRLGIGVPGLARDVSCVWIPNLPYLDGLNLELAFPDTSVALGNDAQFALVAERAAGAAGGRSDALLLAIGTGIGSAVLAGGRIITGTSGGACSFGWASGDPDEAGEDVSGWLERHVSGRALDAMAKGLDLVDGTALVEAAGRGDPEALGALRPPMEALGTALVGAVALLDPGLIILAGGVAKSFDVLAPLILETLRRQLPKHLRGIELKASHFGARASLVGAAFAGTKGPEWRQQSG
jgi:predicted NBD/HSP70 family sugar kinase